MKSSALLLSIKPKYAQKIFQGVKTVELRRVKPPVANGDNIIIYVSSPVKAIIAMTTVEKVDTDNPSSLWKRIKNFCGISQIEFDRYFSGVDIGYAIHIRDLRFFTVPITLPVLRKIWKNFNPPQIYRYVSHQEFLTLIDHQKSSDCSRITSSSNRIDTIRVPMHFQGLDNLFCSELSE